MRPAALVAESPLYYYEAGSGPSVVLLHGMGCAHSIWSQAAADLVRGYHLFLPDLPGHGRSPKPRGPYTLSLYIEYLNRWLNAVSTGPVHLVGHSLGGTLVIALALNRPERVRSVAAISPIRLLNHQPPPQALRAFAGFGVSQVLGKPAAAAVRHYLRTGFGLAEGDVSPELVRLFQETADLSTRAVFSTNRHMGAMALWERVGEVRCPVSLLWGRRDPLFSGEQRAAELARRLTHGRLSLLDCGHLPMIERPEPTARFLAEHLTRCMGDQVASLDGDSGNW